MTLVYTHNRAGGDGASFLPQIGYTVGAFGAPPQERGNHNIRGTSILGEPRYPNKRQRFAEFVNTVVQLPPPL